MTLASILVPHWVSMDVPVRGSNKTYSQHLGLHHYCNSALPDSPCRHFPDTAKDCNPQDRYFCSMWRTSGFLMSFATIAELATLVCFVITIGGGKVKREYGWKVLSILLVTVAIAQFAAMGLVVCFVVTMLPLSRLVSLRLGANHFLRCSPFFSITTSTSPYLAGALTLHGFCVLSVPVWPPFLLVAWLCQPTSSHQKTTDTTSWTTPSSLSCGAG